MYVAYNTVKARCGDGCGFLLENYKDEKSKKVVLPLLAQKEGPLIFNKSTVAGGCFFTRNVITQLRRPWINFALC